MRTRLDCHNRTTYAGVYICADKCRSFCDQLADLHSIAHFDDRGGRCACVHGDRDHNGIRLREFCQRDLFSQLFALAWMNTSVISGQPAVTDLFYEIVDDFEIGFGIITQLNWLIQESLLTSLCFQSLVDLFPCAVLLRVHLAFAVLCAAALAVQKTLGAVDDRTDAAGQVEVALCACVTGLLGQCHAMLSDVIQRITCSDDWKILHFRNDLDTQTTGNDGNEICAFRNSAFQLFLAEELIAQKIDLDDTCDVLALFRGQFDELVAIVLIDRLKFLETFVTGDNENVVLVGKQSSQLFVIFQYILGIVHPFSPFLYYYPGDSSYTGL